MNKKFGVVSLVALGLLLAAPSAFADKGGANVVPPGAENLLLPPDVVAMLNDPRKPPELSVDELRNRIRLAKKGLSVGRLPDNVSEKLQRKIFYAQNELEARSGQAAAPQPAPQQPAAQAPQPAPDGGNDDVQNILNDRRPVNRISTAELSNRAKRAFALARDGGLPDDVRNRLRDISRADRQELAQRQEQGDNSSADGGDGNDEQQQARPAPPPPQPAPPPPQPQPVVDNQTEIAARQFLNNAPPVQSLPDQKLRNRVNRMRDFLSSGQLQPQTVNALRQRLALERDTLRSRNGEPVAPTPVQQRKTKSSTDVQIQIVLGDRRSGDQLSDEELQRRIEVYRDIEVAPDYNSYDPGQRDYWRQTMSRDRDLLRRRMMEERRKREKQIAEEENNGQLSRDIVIEAQPQAVPQGPADDIYVAEADNQQIEDILVAPPRQTIQRRYTVDEVANDPRLRRSVPRLEIDTIHFGFGEALVREEEVGNLDRVGAVMEKILARYPNEIFLVEGHTDAVGSDLSNLMLSRARAEAVKRALTTYYDIPPENLRTAGLGERFLKIPTLDPEPENRRVSISRITNFISQNQ